MCGIAGLVALKRAELGEEETLLVRAMCDSIAHRGPDDSGVEALGRACLGTVRLSILDLSAAGHMPMSDARKRWWISYNGEVYNYRELRTELEQLGHTLSSDTDTEVVLTAFLEWGEASLERIAGMFAFCVYDREEDRLTLVRDRLGIKPVYYTERDGRLAFSSEIKALACAVPELELDRQSLIEWSLYQSVDAPSNETLFEGVRSLLPGQLLRLHNGEIELERYYSPPARLRRSESERLASLSADAVVEEVDQAVRHAVRERLVSDVPVGTLLSGGLDSSLITALAAREREITAFHVSIAESPEHDERPFAEEVAQGLGIELIAHTLRGADFRRELPRVIQLSDLPLTHANSVAYYLIAQKAREHGVLVLLSGEGADELFGGYSWRYRRQRGFQRLQRVLSFLPKRVRAGLELAGASSLGLPVEARRFDQLLPQSVQLIDRFARRDWKRTCTDAYDFVANENDRALCGTMMADLNDFLTPLLRRLDRMSMGASVECRVPFLDHRLAEMALHLPLAYRVGKRADKWVLKEVAKRYLSRGLVERKKMGFPLPLADYIAPFACDAFFEGGFWLEMLGLRPSGLRESFATYRKTPFAFLALVTAEIWGRLNFMGESIDELGARIAELEKGPAR